MYYNTFLFLLTHFYRIICLWTTGAMRDHDLFCEDEQWPGPVGGEETWVRTVMKRRDLDYEEKLDLEPDHEDEGDQDYEDEGDQDYEDEGDQDYEDKEGHGLQGCGRPGPWGWRGTRLQWRGRPGLWRLRGIWLQWLWRPGPRGPRMCVYFYIVRWGWRTFNFVLSWIISNQLYPPLWWDYSAHAPHHLTTKLKLFIFFKLRWH